MLTKIHIVCLYLTAGLFTAILTQNTKDEDLEGIINAIFGQDNNQPDRQCGQVEGTLRGCHECYPCNHSVIIQYERDMQEISEISLINSHCIPTVVCCVSQSVLISRINGKDCGKRVETGRARPAARSILQGEYPWQASIYQKLPNENKFLCAASLIDEGAKALVTAAKCVYNIPPANLYVNWDLPSKPTGKMVAVDRVIVHESYRPERQTDDIALIKLRSDRDIPAAAGEACLPSQPPSHGLSCSTAAVNDFQINNFIPRKKVCEKSNNNQPLHESQLCAATVGGGDYYPKIGAGLFCEPEEAQDDIYYVLYGITSFTQSDSVAVYTNISNYLSWLGKNP